MHNIRTLFIVLGVFGTTSGQVKENDLIIDSNHEIKLNMFNALVLQAIDINYEYLINENSTIGLGALHKYVVRDIEKKWISFEAIDNRKFAVTPYFRRYFSKGHANGFFIEGFTILHSGRDFYFDYNYNSEKVPIGEPSEVKTYESYTLLALGLSFGGKILLKKGFLIEFYTGVGANPFNEWKDGVTRGGLSIGYRF